LKQKGEKFRVRLDVKLEHIVEGKAQKSLSDPCESVVREVMNIFPQVIKDRYMAHELKKLAVFVLEGKPAAIVGERIFLND